MSEVIPPVKNEVPRMLYLREGDEDYAVELGRGLTIKGHGDEARVRFGTMGNDDDYVDVDVNPDDIAPDVPGMSLVQKLTLRFQEAARRGTDVDLRFCSGSERLRRKEQDNLRADYPACVMGMKVGM